MNVFTRLSLFIGITGALGTFSTYRFQAAGGWLPTLPSAIQNWELVRTPISQDVLALLGNPRGDGIECRSNFGDGVICNIVTAGPFENYHDPTVCVGGTGVWELTAKQNIPLDGPGSAEARAMIFRKIGDPKVRLVLYYWQQSRDGYTTSEPMMGNFRDMSGRLRTGFGSVVLGRQNVIVRAYTGYQEDDDPEGLHAQRGVHEISREVYRHLRKEGKE